MALFCMLVGYRHTRVPPAHTEAGVQVMLSTIPLVPPHRVYSAPFLSQTREQALFSAKRVCLHNRCSPARPVCALPVSIPFNSQDPKLNLKI